MADVIHLKPEDYRADAEPEGGEMPPPGAAQAAQAGPMRLGVLGAGPSPAGPQAGATQLLDMLPRWVWIAAGAVAFLGLVYVLQRQFVAKPRRAPRRPRRRANGLARAKAALRELEDDEDD